VPSASGPALFIQLLTAKNVTNTERSRVWAFIPLWIANAIFWALYQQQFTVIPIYSDERLDWHILGMDLPPTLVNSLAPIFVILLGAGFAAMWTKLGDRKARPPRLAPEAYKVNMMALYWTSLAMGTAFAGWCAQFYSQDTEASYFMWVGAVSVIAGIVLFLCRAPIQKLMRDVK